MPAHAQKRYRHNIFARAYSAPRAKALGNYYNNFMHNFMHYYVQLNDSLTYSHVFSCVDIQSCLYVRGSVMIV